MVDQLAFLVVVATGLYLIGLAAAAFLAPALVTRFLNAFASSARAHYTEMLVRLVIGGALIAQAPRMQFSAAFALFGWVLIITSSALLLVPWRWHHKFAQKVVPPVTRRVWLFGFGSLPLGAAILYSVFKG